MGIFKDETMIEMANQNGFGLIAIALDIIAIELCLIDSTRYNIAGGWVCLIASWVVILWGGYHENNITGNSTGILHHCHF